MQGTVCGAGSIAFETQKAHILSAFMKLTFCGGGRTQIINPSISQQSGAVHAVKGNNGVRDRERGWAGSRVRSFEQGDEGRLFP